MRAELAQHFEGLRLAESDPVVDGHLFGAFLVGALILVLLPGPDMILIATLGSRWGPKAGVAATVGSCTGLTVHGMISVVGLAAVLRRCPAFYEGLRWAGVGYLLYLAIATWRSAGTVHDRIAPADAPVARPVFSAFRSAAITNLLNPKVILFNVAFLPQFTNPDLGHMQLQLAVLGATLLAMDLVIVGPVGYFAGTLGRRIRNASQAGTRRVNRVAAGMLVWLAGWLAASA
jgi:threonine/homoserine/homoserine lactone efflux protein